MANEIITASLTETWFAETGDRAVVAEGASVITAGDWAIGTLTLDQTGIAVVVRGQLTAADSAIGLFATDDVTGATISVRVAATGVISDNGRAGIWVVNRFGADVSVAGTIEQSPYGVILRTPDTTLFNTGTISGTQSGVYLGTNDFQNPSEVYTVRNSGLIESGSSRALTFEDCGGQLVNTGTITGDYGIFAVGALSLNIRNDGLIHADLTRAMEFALGAGLAVVVNTGTVSSAGEAIRIDEAELHLFNSGAVAGSNLLGFGENADLFLKNSGVMAGSNLFAEDTGTGSRHIVNTGTITGDLNSSDGSAEYRLINSGLYYGEIVFGGLDDRYDGRGGEITGTVTGGFGNDKLIGGDLAETFDGEWDDDRLQGNGGNDTLRGGDGDDILKGGDGDDLLEGGSGNDRLRGDAGSDVFVFGADSGTDSVVDFDQGIDVLRIADHAGGFAGLGFAAVGRDLLVAHDGGTILLLGLAGATLAPADFDFL